MHFVVSLRHQFNFLKILHKTINSINQCRLDNKLFSCSKCHLLHRRWYTSHVQIDAVTPNSNNSIQNEGNFFDFHHYWPTDVKNEFQRHMIVIEDFVTELEEMALCGEVQKAMRRMRYQYDHWDDAIHGYREMEKGDWLPDNDHVLQRMRTKAFEANVLPHVHCLDLAADGIIKPHVDSSRYCGNTIAGVSLLTDCIMRLKRIDESKYKQGKEGEDTQPSVENQHLDRDNFDGNESEFKYFVDILLKRRSLYIMKDSARYKFTHEVLPTKSLFKSNEVIKNRRISIICRNAS